MTEVERGADQHQGTDNGTLTFSFVDQPESNIIAIRDFFLKIELSNSRCMLALRAL